MGTISLVQDGYFTDTGKVKGTGHGERKI
jgi:hypothetical protein